MNSDDEALARLALRIIDREHFDAFADLSHWFGEAWLELPDRAGELLEWYRSVHPFVAC